MIKLDMLYFGVVENVMDPLFLGRLQVRIWGIHTEDKTKVPTEMLPWAEVFMPVTSACISGIGAAPVGIVQGATVALIPKDPEDLQEWFVLFTAGGMQQKFLKPGGGFSDPNGEYPRNTTNHDTNVLARGDVKNSAVMGDKANSTSSGDVDSATQPPPPPVDPSAFKDAPWMQYANQELAAHINEKDNPQKIKEYHSLGGGSSRWGGETPWCASFVGWCLRQAGVKGSGQATARSYINYGQNLMGNKTIPFGAIIVVRGNRGPSSGHVFFCVKDNGDTVTGVGGNQTSKRSGNMQNGGEVTQANFKKASIVGVAYPTSANAFKTK